MSEEKAKNVEEVAVAIINQCAYVVIFRLSCDKVSFAFISFWASRQIDFRGGNFIKK